MYYKMLNFIVCFKHAGMTHCTIPVCMYVGAQYIIIMSVQLVHPWSTAQCWIHSAYSAGCCVKCTYLVYLCSFEFLLNLTNIVSNFSVAKEGLMVFLLLV